MINKYFKYFLGYGKDDSTSLICDILSFLSENNISQNNILIITIFINSGKEEFELYRGKIKEYLSYRYILLPVAIVAQSPFQSHIAAEIFYITGDFQVIASCKDYKLIKTKYAFELYGVVFSDERNNVSDKVFDELEKILKANDFEISQIVRQWNYIEDILEFSEDEQNYQRFNNARSRFYSKTQWDRGYPAATGIGCNAGGITISFQALKSIDNVNVVSLRNPNQVDAYQYSDKVLVGKDKKATPKFERGKIIVYPNQIDVLVSGTAAIKGESATDIQDAITQTNITISNIDTLLERENIEKHLAKGIIPSGFSYSNVRVYIREEKDFGIVEAICLKKYRNTPLIFLQADICREELLVEIEANSYCNILKNMQ